KKLQPTNKLNALKILDGNTKSLKANFIKADSIPFYGFNFDDGKGVHVDNFSNRGNSGLPIGTFDPKMMNLFHEKLGYDLIILQYGTNVLNYGSYNYSWYEKRMTKVVEHLRKCFPGVPVLVVSTADKSTKYGLEMKTDSAVVPLTQAQKRYAVQTNSAYVNLYTLMGGDGSMVKWAEEVPPLANKDYTHFNFRGSKKISDLIYNQISRGYEQYKRLKGKVGPVVKKTTVRRDSVFHNNDSTHAK
ncbi:membrane protein, partial [Nostoc linckia z13]|uniref:GDSL-type esterase/lipase family protein n=1 Tax=Nostoc linckia TaxID=92942 RepID=UPI000C035CFB